MSIPYEYLTILLFSINYAYENRKIIKYSTLQELYNTILEEVIKNYRDPSFDKIYYLEDAWKEEPEFVKEPFLHVITNILNKYPTLFEIHNSNALKLKKNVSYEDLIIAITNIEGHTKGIQRFYDATFSDEVFKVLNVKTIKNILSKYLNIERVIETAYLHKLDILPKYLFMREIFLLDLENTREEKLDAFRYIALTLEPPLEYDELPINYENWKECDYYVSPEVDKEGSILFDITPQLKSLYQYAIFGSNSLAEHKLSSLISYISFKDPEDEEDEIDDIEPEIISEEDAEIFIAGTEEMADYEEESNSNEVDEDDDDEPIITKNSRTYSSYLNPTIEEIFFTAYLYELDNYLKTNSTPDLVLTKNRLLYALDDGRLELFRDGGIEREHEADQKIQLEESDFDFLMIEAIFFCDEVFKNPVDNNTIKKLLFIKTYYNLTKDHELISIFNKYKDQKEYLFYSNIVFGNTLGNTLKRNLEV